MTALAAAVAVLSAGSKAAPSGPLRRAEITRVVNAFARAYGRRDVRALASLLAPEVARADPASIDRGRAAVSAVYRAELSDGSIAGYRVAGLRLTSGWDGRAAARYSILRIGRPNLIGQVTFGVERSAAARRSP